MTEAAKKDTAIGPTREQQEHKIHALMGHEKLTLEQVQVLKNTVAKRATNEELSLFLTVAGRTKLDPFTRQIHFVKRWDSSANDGKGGEVGAIQTGIDGYRLIAERTGKYGGRDPYQWCGEDGVWLEAWLHDEPPAAARVSVYRIDWQRPIVVIARYKSYCQRKKGGEPTHMWTKFDAEQLAKCGEALALRTAFPQELSDVYTDEEMEQIGDGTPPELKASGRARRGLNAETRAAAAESSAEVLNEVVSDSPRGPEPEGEGGQTEDEPRLSTVTVEEFFALCRRARAQLKPRMFVKEAPPGSKAYWFVDQKILSVAGVEGSVCIQDEGADGTRHPCDPGVLYDLHNALLGELEAESGRAA